MKVFVLDKVAPIPVDTAAAGQPFRLTPTNDIPYPTKDMEKALLDERTKPVKTVLLQPDQPKDIFYVFVLAKRDEKSVEDFRRDVYAAPQASPMGGGGNPGGQAVMRAQRGEAGRRAMDSVLELIKKELNYVETDDQKKKIEDKDRRGDEG